jgi:hypothetical protein
MITPHGGSQTLSWRQTYTFDRYGNRRFDTTNNNTTTLPNNCGTPQSPAVCPEDVARLNPEINPANNRLSSPGWQYDAAGNTIRDAENRRFTYDGENKQVRVETVDANGNPIATIGQYFYDGDGGESKRLFRQPAKQPCSCMMHLENWLRNTRQSSNLPQPPKPAI